MQRKIAMTRAVWSDSEQFRRAASVMNLTVLFTQWKNKRLSQLCLESLLRFYPDIPILIVDNASGDDALLYAKWLEVTNRNITVWERLGRNSHGMTMNEAIREHINTKYVMLLDSDVIIERGGFIEGMLKEYESNPRLYAIGTYMPGALSNQAVGDAQSESDLLNYAHPSLSIYQREIYLTLPPFMDHGAPCCYNCQGAQEAGLDIVSWPVDLYASHLSGGSWTQPYRTIWADDHDVKLRPFVTFIVDDPSIITQLQAQTDQDFDIITPLQMDQFVKVVLPITGIAQSRDIKSDIYPLRYRATGEYICRISGQIFSGFVDALKRAAISLKGANTIIIGGAACYRRRYWQNEICLNT